jgi:hypothetical protein
MTLTIGRFTTIQGLPTSGARAVAPFTMDGEQYLAVPQMARDIPGQAPYMNGGDSDIEMPIFRWRDGRFEPWRQVPLAGGEDVEFFEIGSRRFLAGASLRTGSGPYEYNAMSTIFEWNGTAFEPFQQVPTFAAKQWRHFSIGARHFLALAQGVVMPGLQAIHPSSSMIFEWNGERFVEFQKLPSGWGYNFCAFELGGIPRLAYADHHAPSILMTWNGSEFVLDQVLDGASGRAFAPFSADGADFLAFANLQGDTLLYRREGGRYVVHQTLSGPGGRELAIARVGGALLLVQANFLTGSPQAPKTDLESVVYAWERGRLVPAQRFATFGATGAAVFERDGHVHLAVSESLDAGVRFRTDSHIHRFLTPAEEQQP